MRKAGKTAGFKFLTVRDLITACPEALAEMQESGTRLGVMAILMVLRGHAFVVRMQSRYIQIYYDKNGKIARLPLGIREELNRRLQDG